MASSQQILPSGASSSFPACGLSCAVLVAAQSTCDSTYPAGTAQLTYENCFCTQGSVQPLYASPDGLCTAECTAESDRTTLQQWFTSFCKDVGQGIDPKTQTATAQSSGASSTTVVTVTSTSSNPTAAATNSGNDYSNSLSGSSGNQGPWINSHWRWLLMLGILIVGLGLLTWLAVWLKHRHRSKTESQRISMSGFPSPTEKKDRPPSTTADLWGPHQHMHATNGWQYQPDPASTVAEDDYASKRQETRRSKRDSARSSRGIDLGSEVRHSASSRTLLAKGKRREPGASPDLSPESSRYGQSHGRSHRHREGDIDSAQDGDPEKGIGTAR
ncbi:hypothetical protein DV736_g5955, partial [Chaetothyriales sp. CBS 134916]